MPKHTLCESLEEALELIAKDEESVLEVNSHAQIGDKGATAIAQALRSPGGGKGRGKLSIVILPSQKIGPEGAAELGAGLNKNMDVTELHLPNNPIGYEGVKRLADALAAPWTKGGSKPGNKVLKVLGLKSCDIEPHCGDCQMCRFSPLFPISLLDVTSLRMLDLHSNNITDLPLQICEMPHLVGLDVRKNPLDNIPRDVFVTAREGHQTGWPVLKAYMKTEYQKGHNRS